jgi:hypothetical protein
MKTSKILKHVKANVRKPGEHFTPRYGRTGRFIDRYICHASVEARLRGLISLNESSKVQRLLMGRLAGSDSLEQWLDTHHGIKQKFYDDGDMNAYYAYVDRMQITRHAWLDSMIKEFRLKGD